jgi:hypothetical protein
MVAPGVELDRGRRRLWHGGHPFQQHGRQPIDDVWVLSGKIGCLQTPRTLG